MSGECRSLQTIKIKVVVITRRKRRSNMESITIIENDCVIIEITMGCRVTVS